MIKLPLFKLADGTIINLREIAAISPLNYEWSSEYGYHSHYKYFHCKVTLSNGGQIECRLTEWMGISSGDTHDKVEKLNKQWKNDAEKFYNEFIKAWNAQIIYDEKSNTKIR